jgi:hypothetical protein
MSHVVVARSSIPCYPTNPVLGKQIACYPHNRVLTSSFPQPFHLAPLDTARKDVRFDDTVPNPEREGNTLVGKH